MKGARIAVWDEDALLPLRPRCEGRRCTRRRCAREAGRAGRDRQSAGRHARAAGQLHVAADLDHQRRSSRRHAERDRQIAGCRPKGLCGLARSVEPGTQSPCHDRAASRSARGTARASGAQGPDVGLLRHSTTRSSCRLRRCPRSRTITANRSVRACSTSTEPRSAIPQCWAGSHSQPRCIFRPSRCPPAELSNKLPIGVQIVGPWNGEDAPVRFCRRGRRKARADLYRRRRRCPNVSALAELRKRVA